jgi:stage III sporulation protein AA
MQDSLVSLCGWAVHSHQQELTNGYISVRGGNRRRIAATAVVEDRKVTAVRECYHPSILRIARKFSARRTF